MINEHDLDQLESLAKMNIEGEGIGATFVEVSNKASLEIVQTIRTLREYKTRIDDAVRSIYRNIGKPEVGDDVIKALWECSQTNE